MVSFINYEYILIMNEISFLIQFQLYIYSVYLSRSEFADWIRSISAAGVVKLLSWNYQYLAIKFFKKRLRYSTSRLNLSF